MGVVHRGNGVAHSRTDSLEKATVSDRLSDNERSRGFRGLWSGQKPTLILFAVSLLLLIRYISLPVSYQLPISSTSRPAHLHVVIPASKEDANLCKVLLSAAALGYPSPAIINWHKEFNDNGLVEGGSHLAKISGVHNYLVSLDASHDEDLVLMVDGFDIWFQLRPQTLIDRYFEINRRADERIRRDLGPTADRHNIRQEIVFGCQKRCWPWTFEDPPCYAMPESTLPRDIYGPKTDTDIGNEENPYIKYRQRYLNSGVGIGTVRAMRKLFGQALARAQEERNFGSDQYIISHIFGDQELWREALRRKEKSSTERLRSFADPSRIKAYPEKHLAEVREKAAGRIDKNYEFGIGVDYESKIGLNTVFAEDDTEWLTFDNQTQIHDVQQARDIDPMTGRLTGLESDVATSVPPFWTFSYEKHLPRWTKWSEITLFTNIWTGITPAIIHHNAHRNGMKSLRETWWPNVFYLKYARTLLDAYVYAPITPFAYSGYDKTSMREWWPYEIWKGGARSGNASVGSAGDENWIRFDLICRDYHEEIFRDGKGPWDLPAVH